MSEHDGHRDRLRQQFLNHGMDPMRDYEILELLLFYAIPRKDTNLIARQLLRHFGSLASVLDASAADLQQIPGIGEGAAVLLHMIAPLSQRYLRSKTETGTILKTTADCGSFLLPYFVGETDEVVYLLCLDAKNKLLNCRLLQRGSMSSVSVSIRKAAEIAMACNATSVVLAHNHPGGLALPSSADYTTTKELETALKPLGIELADHIVIADNDYVSFRANGYMD